MRTITKRDPLPLLGKRRFMVVPAKDIAGTGNDWKFEHREFLTLGDARRKLAKKRKSPFDAGWYIIEFYLPTGQVGTLCLNDESSVPIRVRIV